MSGAIYLFWISTAPFSSIPLFSASRSKNSFSETTVGVLPHEDGEVGGCLFIGEQEKPSERGILIYLNVNGRFDDALAAVTARGGKVLQPKHPIGPFGFRSVILDSEGNRVALHSD